VTGELTNEELILLYDAVISNVNSQFQLWLTVTFAVIVAAHVGRTSLSRPLRYLAAVLYLSVSVLLLTAVFYASEVGAAGGINALVEGREGVTRVLYVLRPFVWMFGTVATLVFLFSGGRGTSSSGADD